MTILKLPGDNMEPITEHERDLWDKWADQAQLYLIHNLSLKDEAGKDADILEFKEAA